MNRKYIEDAKRKAAFPETFIYANLIRKIKKNFKEFFIDPKDLVQNSNGQINRKKGGKRTLSQGIYEFGEGFFDLKFDGKIGIRSNVNPKNKKMRLSISAVNKANHFWWLISKAYLNKFVLQDARNTLKSFLDDPKAIESIEENKDEDYEETIENIPINLDPLFSSKWLDFNNLIKGDKDLEGIKKEDIDERNEFHNNWFISDELWDNAPISDDFSDDLEEDTKFYSSRLDNASENDVKNVINIIEDRFLIENKESMIAKRHVGRSSKSLNTPEVKYGDIQCDQDEWFIHDKEILKKKFKSLKEHRIKEIRVSINSLIELHTHKFIDDTVFYSDMKSLMDKLHLMNEENIFLKESLLENNLLDKIPESENKEEFKEPIPTSDPCQLDNVIKNLQSQLLCSKSDNILSFQNLQKETESHIIDEQEENLNKQVDYMRNCIAPLKNIYVKLYEECAVIEQSNMAIRRNLKSLNKNLASQSSFKMRNGDSYFSSQKPGMKRGKYTHHKMNISKRKIISQASPFLSYYIK